MYSNARIINNLAEFAANYTEDLARPFESMREENAEAETPILIIADICKLLGMTDEQTQRVLGEAGTAFIEYLNAPIDVHYILAARAQRDPDTVNAFGMLIPIAGKVGEDGNITLNDYGRKVLQ